VNSASVVGFQDLSPTSQTPATIFWSESFWSYPEKAIGFLNNTEFNGYFSSLAISPITVMPDPWLQERVYRNAVVTVLIYKEVIGHFISRSEALRIARQILVHAEQERLAIAEFEATKGIQWGDQI